jgi:mannose-6-phosphate isomerase-like protein (cupin superfamily)
MSNAVHFEAGPIEQWDRWQFTHPKIGRPMPGKLMLGEPLGLSGMEVSLNTFPPGAVMPFAHRHRAHEELYLFLSGRGELWVDDERFQVGPGSCVRVAPAGARVWRNTGDEPLSYVVIQAHAEPPAPVRGIADGEVCPVPPDWPVRAPRAAGTEESG